MRFSHDKVSHYLRLVNDKNELHSTIVPGQLVVDCVLAYFQIEWTQFNMVKTIGNRWSGVIHTLE
ncbi:MAG: hypothetical protein DI610_09215, partial [Staphylococcus hominis]